MQVSENLTKGRDTCIQERLRVTAEGYNTLFGPFGLQPTGLLVLRKKLLTWSRNMVIVVG